MRDLQILILDLQGNQLGELDLTDSDDFALKLTKSLASINDLGRRNTSYSLDFDAPQTKNNNKLLAGLRFATHSKEILGQKPCSILVDGNQVDRGFLYPFESELDGMYKLNFKGLNNDWVERLRDVELNELNWRDWKTGLRTVDATESFTGARFDVLNALNSDTVDLTYPYVNRNNTGYAGSFRPQIHMRSIVYSMFQKIGYTVSSAFLESAWIKGAAAYTDSYGNAYEHLGIGVDPVFQLTREPQDLIGEAIEYSVQGASTTLDPNAWLSTEMLGNLGTPSVPNQRSLYRFPNLISTVVTDDNTRFDPVTSEFTVGTGGAFNLDFNFNFEYAWFDTTVGVNDWIYYTGLNSIQQHAPSFKWYVLKNNISNDAIDSPSNIIFQGSTPVPSNIQTIATTHNFATGDKISVFLELNDDAFGHGYAYLDTPPALQYWRLRIANNSVLTIVPKEDVQLGDEFRINSHIPEGIKCLSLLQDFKTLFNLYFDVDVNRKLITIEPRDDFYTGNTVDITDIIDLNTPPSLNYLTDYKNEMVFEYATDSKDKYLEQWNKINNKTYAQYKYLFNNNERFDKGQSVLSTSILAPTIQGALNGNDNIMSSIVKEEYLDADNANKPVNKNYKARVFQLIRGRQYDSAGVPRRTSSPLTVLTAAMEDYANTPTFENRKLTFIGTRGLVEDYYAKTLANIEDTAVLKLKINLSLYAFNSWDLRKTYYISEPAELAGYYITDSITNFNVTKETPTTITLVKFKDFTPVATQGGVGNVNVITQTATQPQPIMCVVNGIVVPCLNNNLGQLYTI
jgi:hypothetical protein